MKILVLLKNAGIEQSTAFIEVIKALVEKKNKIHIVIGNQADDYVREEYYYNEPNIEIEVLNTVKNRESKIESLKKIIRKWGVLEKICENVLLLIERIIFRVREKKIDDKNKFAFDEFLNSSMQDYIVKDEYDYIWTIDEYGLLWAEWINQKYHKKFKLVYYCLELYWEHFSLPEKKKWKYFKEYVLFEKAREVLLKVSIIIIQDEPRWKVLCQYTGIDNDSDKILLPVSIKNYEKKLMGNLHDRLGINAEKKIIFYPTLIAPKRGCIELTQMVEHLEDRFVTVIHGFASIKGFADKLGENISTSKIIISNTTFGYQELVDMHQDVWCVFLYYGENDNNDKYIANSSNKLAMSLQAGKPIITIGNRMLAELCEEYECGKALMKWSEEEFAEVVHDIEENYDLYCKNARKCYKEKYDIGLYKEAMYSALLERC